MRDYLNHMTTIKIEMTNNSAARNELVSRPSLSDAHRWARTAKAGEYLVTYAQSGLTDAEDPGSRCGYSDPELDDLGRTLRERGLSLEADDRGLCAVAVES